MRKAKNEEKLRQEKELANAAARWPVGTLVRYNAGHGWYHARIAKYEKAAVRVQELTGGNTHKVDVSAIADAVFG